MADSAIHQHVASLMKAVSGGAHMQWAGMSWHAGCCAWHVTRHCIGLRLPKSRKHCREANSESSDT